MNQTHLHLLINHLPIFGTILGSVVLAYGLGTKSNTTKVASYLVFIIAAVGGLIAFQTGGAAAGTVDKIQSANHEMMEEHAKAADYALYVMIILAVLSVSGIILTSRNSKHTRTIAIVTLLMSLFSFSVVARTGYLGGLIRHTEVNTSSSEGN